MTSPENGPSHIPIPPGQEIATFQEFIDWLEQVPQPGVPHEGLLIGEKAARLGDGELAQVEASEQTTETIADPQGSPSKIVSDSLIFDPDGSAHEFPLPGLESKDHSKTVAASGPIDYNKLGAAVAQAQASQAKADRATADARRKAQVRANFLTTTTNPEALNQMISRANWLQRNVDNVLRDISQDRGNSMGLNAVTTQFAQEFIRLISDDRFLAVAGDFSISEGGLRLLQRGLLAGCVPSKDQLDNLRLVWGAQNVARVNLDANGNPHPALIASPRYFKDGEPGFGPYESPDQDSVALVEELLDPDSWKLSPADYVYLQSILLMTKLDTYENAAGPSGAKYFWNRKPWNLYVKSSVKAKRDPSTTEQARAQRMGDPARQTSIGQSNSVFEWWEASVGKSYVGNSPIDKANKKATILHDVQKYAQDRIALDATL